MAHAEKLTPLIAACVESAGVRLADLEQIVVGLGPGPFTGLRVGIVSAQVLASVLGCALHGVCSLDVLAAQHAAAADGEFVVATDARRREVYWARYAPDGGQDRRPGRCRHRTRCPTARRSGPAHDLYAGPAAGGTRTARAGSRRPGRRGPGLPDAGHEPALPAPARCDRTRAPQDRAALRRRTAMTQSTHNPEVSILAARRDDLPRSWAWNGAGFAAGEQWSERSWQGELLGDGRTTSDRPGPPPGRGDPLADDRRARRPAPPGGRPAAPARGGSAPHLVRAGLTGRPPRRRPAVMLEVAYGNEPAIALYQRLGFEQLPARRELLRPGSARADPEAVGPAAGHPLGSRDRDEGETR